MTAFIGEALRIEHAINSLHPFGYEATINDQDVVFAPDLPTKAVVVMDGAIVGGLVARLPDDVRDFRAAGWSRGRVEARRHRHGATTSMSRRYS